MSGTIPFTQFLRPDGRQKGVFFECDDPKVLEKALVIIKRGLRFECEELMNGMVSMTISNQDEDLAFQLVPNGPQVPEAVKALVMEFNLDDGASTNHEPL